MADSDAFERDMKDFKFLQLCKFRVHPSSQELPINRGNLLACSSKYGLLVYCTKQGFSVVKTSNLMKINEGLGKERNKVVIEDIPVEKKIDLNTPVLCLSINCEGKYLAVVTKEMGQLSVLFYDINGFADKNAQAFPFARARINATPAAVIQDLCWNPAAANMLAVCTSDGNVEVIDVADNPKVIAALPAAVGATCFCWSPKGKQLLVGKKNGSASQYDHSLAEKKQWPCPNVLQGSQKVVDILWQSTYTFMAAYLPSDASSADQPKAVLVVSNKENKTLYMMFDDIVFGSGEERKAQYFFHLVLQWEMMLIASSNATEATVVGKNLDDKVSWDHWNLEDCSRAELPLTQDQNDSFPVGMAVDYSPQAQIVINESVQYPACPVMYLLSTDGMLLGFHLFYRHKDAVPITVATSALEPNAARKGVPGLIGTAQNHPNIAAANTPAMPAATNLSQNAPSAPAAFITSTPSTAGLFGLSGQTTRAAPSFQFAVPGGATSKPPPLFSSTPPTAAPQPPNGLSAGLKAPPAASFPSATSGFGAVAVPGASSKTVGENAASNTQGGSGFAGFGSADAKFGGSLSTPQSSAFVSPTTGQSQQQGALGSKPTPQFSPAFQALPKSVPAQPISSTPATAFGGAPSNPSSTVTPPTSVFGTEKGKSPASSMSAFIPSKPSPQSQQVPNAQPISNVTGTLKQTPAAQKDIGLPPGYPVESQKSIDARLDSAFTQNIIEEIRDFEEELKQLRLRAQSGVRHVGTREEMQQLRQDTEKMVNFSKEIKLVTKEHLREAQEQKNTSYNLFAMAEECRVKHERDQDPHYHSLLQGRTLDPASAERLKRLQGMAQALEQSVVEVDTVLNAQWDEHQARRRKVERIATPTSDIIYKSIKNNHDLISDQRHKLEKVEEQLHNLKLYSRSGFRDLQALTFSNGAGMSSLLETKKPEKTMQEAVSSGMTPDKVSRLKDLLSQRSVPVIKSSPLANLSMSRIVAQTPPSGGKTPSSSSQGRSQQQQQQQQKLQQQQQQQQSTPTGPPPSQVAVPVGKLSFVPDQSQQQKYQLQQPQAQLLKQTQSFVSSGQKPLNQVSMFSGAGLQQQQQQFLQNQKQQQQQLQHQQQRSGPTSFSGVAFFKQPSPSALSGTGTEGVLGQIQPAQPVGSVAVNQSSVPQSIPTVVSQGAPKQGAHLSQLLQSNMYEDLTPTETEEEDGYDEEEDGYEDEDEDEEETKFVGNSNMPGSGVPVLGTGGGGDGASFFKVPQTVASAAAHQAFTPLRTTTQTQAWRAETTAVAPPVAAPASSSTSSVPTTTARQAASKDLFGAKVTTATAGAESTVSARSGSIGFSFGQASATATNLTAAVTTTTATATAATASTFSFGKPSSSTFGGQPSQPSTNKAQANFTSTSAGDGSNLFTVTTGSKTGFSFGAPALFGQKLAGSAPTISQGSLFGAQATPSKNVGFVDLSKPAGGKDEEKQSATDSLAKPKSPASSPTSTTAASSAPAPAKSSANIFSFSTAPSSLSGGSAFGGAKLEGNTAPSVFGGSGAQSPGGSTFGFKLTPTSSATSSASADFSFKSALGSVSTAGSASSSPSVSTAQQASAQAESTSTASPLFGTAPGSTLQKEQPKQNTTSPTASTSVSTPATISTTTPTVFGTSASPPSADTTKTSVNPAAASGSTLSGKPVSPEQQKSPGVTLSQVTSATTTTVAATPVFGSNSSSAGLTAAVAPPSVTATTTGASSLFGKSQGGTFSFVTTPSSTSSETTGIFGSSTATTTDGASSGLFGASTASAFGSGTANSGGLFGAATSTTSSSDGVFGAPAASTTSSGGLFGASTTTKSGGLFGAPTSSTSSGGLFGAAAASSSGGLFGATTSTTSGGLFGAPTASTSSGGLFGVTAPTTAGGLFGATASTSSGGLFGTPAASTTSGGLFGAGTTTKSGGLFGAPAAATTSGGLFGAPSSSTPSGGIFGAPATSTSSGGLFGATASTSSGGLFGAPSTSTSGGLFGATASTSSGGLFGQQPASSTPGFGFGQQTTSASTFGQPSGFGQPASSSSGGLMGFSGLGGKPSEEKAKQNVFGTPQNFGSSTTQNTGLFGTGTSSSLRGFGSTSSPSTGGGGGSFLAGGGGGVGSSGFGVAAPPQPSAATGGFGASPAFGSSPSFGGSAVFGSKPAFGSASPGGFGTAPAFGSSPGFGSPAFGSGSAGVSSGAGSAPSGGFSSFANAAAPSFGALAQSSSSSPFGGGGGFGASAQPTSQPFGGGGGGFGSPQQQQQPVFGQGATSPGFGGGAGAQSSGFGAPPSFGGSPAFNSYRG